MNASKESTEYNYDKQSTDFSYKNKYFFEVDCKRNLNLKHETRDRLKAEVKAKYSNTILNKHKQYIK